jgi:signal transduction histidine kinase
MVMPGKHAVSLALLEIFAGMAWRMHQVFRNALAAAETAKAELENRVQHISNDMEQNFNQMAEMRVEQVAAKERKRIAADLHDDLGAKLLTIVHTSDNERIATLAREALEEMRLSVRGLTGRPMQLGDALGDWRSEVMGRLSQSGIELVWDIADDLLMSERKMSARVYVQTTRILREAVSNLLKHSGASHCDIVVRVDVNDFELIITDNGKGIPMELDGKLDRGHGMSTMKSRAKQLQGQCLVESGPGYGTTIRLTLPL